MRAIAEVRRRFGYRRLPVLLKREGYLVHHMKLVRLYREEEACGTPQWGRKRAIRTAERALVARLRVGSTHAGRRFRIPAVVDDCTRECLIYILHGLQKRTDSTVIAGPFAGMKYISGVQLLVGRGA
jgi:putative transposase